jgi:hypothetical protein
MPGLTGAEAEIRIGNVLLTGWDQYFISILKFIDRVVRPVS